MKKSILNLGKALNKAEQKTVNGGKTQDLCTNCGYYTPNMMTCFSLTRGRYDVPCIPQ